MVKNYFRQLDEIGKINSSVEIIDAKRVIVEEFIKIIDYCENRVVLDIGKKLLVICGTELNIYDYFNKNIVIDGKITSISFE